MLTQNLYHNGHPDLIPAGRYAADAIASADQGVEIKVTRSTGAVDSHGARPGWVCVFRYQVDSTTEPTVDRVPTAISEILLAQLGQADFRTNQRGALGTRTASPNRDGLKKLRANPVYQLPSGT